MNGTQLNKNRFESWGRYQPNNIDFLRPNADCCFMESEGYWLDDNCDALKPLICEITL